ncbi:hypothetical protein [Novilysobacter selenitireducens]|uniref:Uncharacterized protein n=1 Tax=Novilysobacter selenitireducens TaxID=2872639 RepID=A0ABS7T439_9GAMM|nr:hypothetical protein [Lysobacter selenitireducens]MBZ4038645.1 hypothetical protein [Lysobacter selenitireducens]
MDMATLTAALDEHDELVRALAFGRLSLAEFLEQYDNFYWAFAFDGHEAKPDSSALASLASRIEPHRRIAEEVLALLAPEFSAEYRTAGRIGPTEATDRIKLIAHGLPVAGA